MNMGFPLPVALILLGIGHSYATQIKYIVRSGPFDANPEEILGDKWRREFQSMVGSADNSLQATTEATYQDCTLDGSCSDLQSDGFGAEGTFKPFPQDHLQKILQKFQKGDTKLANLYIDRSDVNEGIQTDDNGPHPLPEQPQNDKSKSWNTHNTQQNNKYPYDDRQGWVTLEPIAWSSSQIQKWEPNPRPTFPPPNEAANYWNGGPSSNNNPSYGPPVSSERPPWNKPSYEYNTNPKPQWGNKYPSNQNYEYKPTYATGGSWGGNSDIITDNRPGAFPPDNRPTAGSHDTAGYRPWASPSQASPSYNKPTYSYGSSYSSSSERPSSSNYQSSADGDGHWVLLSSTKGYSIPQRHRSNSRSMNLKELENGDSGKEYPKTITANIVSNMSS
ncbi:hypothetical protein WDU94_008817 [Cyamophila willieti]